MENLFKILRPFVKLRKRQDFSLCQWKWGWRIQGGFLKIKMCSVVTTGREMMKGRYRKTVTFIVTSSLLHFLSRVC
jgi:hypothetical protein